MKRGRMISTSQKLPYRRKRYLEFVSENIHHYLARVRNFFFPPLFNQLFFSNTIKITDYPENIIRMDVFLVILDKFGEDLLGIFKIRRKFMEFAISNYPV